MNKKYIVIATIIILAIGGGVYVWQNNTSPYKEWRIYRNREMRYSIRYPENYSVKEFVSGKNALEIDAFGNKKLSEIVIENSDSSARISLVVFNNFHLLSPEEWAGRYKDTLLNIFGADTHRKVVIGGNRMISSEIQDSSNPNVSLVIVRAKGSKVFQMAGLTRIIPSEAGDIIEKIFNSLRMY